MAPVSPCDAFIERKLVVPVETGSMDLEPAQPALAHPALLGVPDK